MNEDRSNINDAVHRLRQRDEPLPAACERLDAAIRAESVHLWADDAPVHPSFFAGHLSIAVKFEDGRALDEAEIAMLRTVERPRMWSVSRVDVERLAKSQSSGLPRRDTRGVKSEINWEEVVRAAAVLMVRNKYKKLVELKKAVYAHFGEEWTEGGPEDSTMKEHLGPLHAELKAALGI